MGMMCLVPIRTVMEFSKLKWLCEFHNLKHQNQQTGKE